MKVFLELPIRKNLKKLQQKKKELLKNEFVQNKKIGKNNKNLQNLDSKTLYSNMLTH